MVTHFFSSTIIILLYLNLACAKFLNSHWLAPTVILSVALLFCYHITLFSFQGAGIDLRPKKILEQTSIVLRECGVVEINGIEPLTPCLQSRCSTS